jgi:hypothetical protein
LYIFINIKATMQNTFLHTVNLNRNTKSWQGNCLFMGIPASDYKHDRGKNVSIE